MASFITKLLGLSAYTGLVAVTLPHIQNLNVTNVLDILPFTTKSPQPLANDTLPPPEESPLAQFTCLPQNYTTQIVSLDPLVIYIHNFLDLDRDIPALLEAGEPAFKPSFVYKDGRTQGTPDRTSSSAGLPLDAPVVRCVLARAEAFMGTMLAPGRDEIGAPQLVRYTTGQRFNVHHDWYDDFQPDLGATTRSRRRRWNRVASFFAILEDDCSGGETYFPKIEAVAPQHLAGERLWRGHEDGGIAFRPVRGNALFWVNLFPNGTGDPRTVHAGLPLGDGLKTAMNIWPKQFIGPEAWGPEEKAGGGAEGVVDDAEVDPV